MIKCERDEQKNKTNRQKHGIWFEEAVTVFNDPQHRFFLGQYHSKHEDLFILLGMSGAERLLVVIHAYSDV